MYSENRCSFEQKLVLLLNELFFELKTDPYNFVEKVFCTCDFHDNNIMSNTF